MNPTFTGGCQCGAIRYECSAERSRISMLKCHCRDCQQVTGGPYTPVVYVPAGTLRIVRGQVKHHFTPSARGGHHKRGFCADCGSRLTGGESERGIGVTASSLDHPTFFQPQVEMWVADAQPWDALDPKLPQFAQFPPAPGKT